MLDKKYENVLAALQRLAPVGYTVLTKSEITQQLPKRTDVGTRDISGILGYLKDNDYIDVKYQDKDEVCLCLTVKTETYFRTERKHVEKAQIANGQLWILLGCVFLAAFLGAFVATLIGNLL